MYMIIRRNEIDVRNSKDGHNIYYSEFTQDKIYVNHSLSKGEKVYSLDGLKELKSIDISFKEEYFT